MYQVEKFSNLPNHQSLIDRATKVLIEDPRVIGLCIGGSQKADEYSDVDLFVYCKTEEDRESLKKDRLKIAEKVGEIKAESISIFPYVYVVFYEEEEIKVDYSWHLLPEANRPDKAHLDILYDPEGHLKKLKEESTKLVWKIDEDELKHKTKHYHIGISYTVFKIARGELWDAQDAVDFYRKYLVEFEDILAQRKRENYRKLEEKLGEEKLKKFNETLVREISRKEIFRAMDAVFNYFNEYLKDSIEKLNAFPYEQAEKMYEYYDRIKKLVLEN